VGLAFGLALAVRPARVGRDTPLGSANWVSAAADVAGGADLTDGTHHGFLWNNGHMRDLLPVENAPCSNSNAVNNPGEGVGNIADCLGDELAAVLWSHGQGYDLNTLIAPSALHLTSAEYINDQGEIVGHGVLPNGGQRVFLLIPNPSVPLPAVPRRQGRLRTSALRGSVPHWIAARRALGPARARAAEERGAAMSAAAALEYALLLTEDPGPRQPEMPPGLGTLSARERELVTLVAQGH
jgi:probable HAF family extracellular repeat protein